MRLTHGASPGAALEVGRRRSLKFLAESYRVAVIASSSWVADELIADHTRYMLDHQDWTLFDALANINITGATLTREQMEQAGQHEMLNRRR